MNERAAGAALRELVEAAFSGVGALGTLLFSVLAVATIVRLFYLHNCARRANAYFRRL